MGRAPNLKSAALQRPLMKLRINQVQFYVIRLFYASFCRPLPAAVLGELFLIYFRVIIL